MVSTTWQICLMAPSCAGGIWQSCGGIACIEAMGGYFGQILGIPFE